jgi:predicted nucleotidyltransferase
MPERIADWPLRRRAEQLRQWPTLVRLVERAHTLPGFGAFVLVGSFAGGSPDHMSDVDAIISIDDGAFELAWDSRSALFESPPAVAWDRRADPEREVGELAWVTHDLVPVECMFATPAGNAGLGDPHVVLSGDPARVGTFRSVPPISRAQVEAQVERNRLADHPGADVMRAYEELARAMRAVD